MQSLTRKLRIAPNETIWFDSMQDTLDELPESESEFIARQLALADRSRFLPEEYGLNGKPNTIIRAMSAPLASKSSMP
jgi:hypothetical protein